MAMRRKTWLAAVLSAAALALSGCGENVVFLTGRDGTPVFSVGEKMVTQQALSVYYENLQREYEALLGADIWQKEGNENLWTVVRDNALAQISKVAVLDEMAGEDGVTLTEDETAACQSAADAYYASLTDAEKQYFGLSEEDFAGMYEDYCLAGAEYQSILSSSGIEVSDDEARSVTCQYICFLAADDAMTRAKQVRQEITDGMNQNLGKTFLQYIAEYNEDSSSQMSISRASSDEALIEAAFSLELNGISDPVESSDGNVYILKCISLSDDAETEANKAVIQKQREEEAYESACDEFLQKTKSGIDQTALSGITLVTDDSIKTSSFFTTYDQYLGEETGLEPDLSQTAQ